MAAVREQLHDVSTARPQALLAYCAGEVGPKALFDEGEGPLQGPVGTTHVSLPACREHEETAAEEGGVASACCLAWLGPL